MCAHVCAYTRAVTISSKLGKRPLATHFLRAATVQTRSNALPNMLLTKSPELMGSSYLYSISMSWKVRKNWNRVPPCQRRVWSSTFFPFCENEKRCKTKCRMKHVLAKVKLFEKHVKAYRFGMSCHSQTLFRSRNVSIALPKLRSTSSVA